MAGRGWWGGGWCGTRSQGTITRKTKHVENTKSSKRTGRELTFTTSGAGSVKGRRRNKQVLNHKRKKRKEKAEQKKNGCSVKQEVKTWTATKKNLNIEHPGNIKQ